MTTAERSTSPRPRRSGLALGSAVLLTVAVVCSLGGAASAAPVGEFTTFHLGNGGNGGNALASGSDGNMWFTNTANNSIGRITPAGSVTYFKVPTKSSTTLGSGLLGITAGPDGNMWFTGFFANIVGKVTPEGKVTTYPLPISEAYPLGIAAGPDGNVWFALDGANGIGRISPSGRITLYSIDGARVTSSRNCVMCGYEITAGPLDSLWFTMPAAGMVGRITTKGEVSTLPVPTETEPATNTTPVLGAITAGSDGNLWITQDADGKITRMTPQGTTTDFPLTPDNSIPASITPGPGASLWVAAFSGNALTRVDISGGDSPPTITQFPIPAPDSDPAAVALGADGSMWFANLVLPRTQPGSVKLQVGRVGTGFGALVKAKVTGTAKAGSTLTCSYSTKQAGVIANVDYQWLRAGKPIHRQNARTFKVASADKGAAISCRAAVTYESALYQ
ncbi:MAG: hypothetical protein ACKOMX_05940 [Actinomycetota bacterium]